MKIFIAAIVYLFLGAVCLGIFGEHKLAQIIIIFFMFWTSFLFLVIMIKGRLKKEEHPLQHIFIEPDKDAFLERVQAGERLIMARTEIKFDKELENERPRRISK